ncbi:hypothetical protein, partial [Sandarakinorhabdus glacialis]|uniref:hypothetical protein n=1 Tax=Sandarakinorhabdus glacialis TaxID=1614636 RepID=UPI001FB125AA
MFGHVRFGKEDPEDPFYRVNLAGLYGADHWETRRMLIGCLDFALAIAVVLTRALDRPDQQHQEQLQALNDLKNVVSEDFQQGRFRENRVEAYYQPIVRLDTREIVGLEALCRIVAPNG